MTYRQSLFFVANCLTLDQHQERIEDIKGAIHSPDFNWQDVVRLGSEQFVLPAMYLQLSRNGLLAFLPNDLIEHLDDITTLNRVRNEAILAQAKEIIEILDKKNITPVFLKGVAHLFYGLYVDIAERMIGDIDILVPSEKIVESAHLLMNEGYQHFGEFKADTLYEIKNYPPLTKNNYPAPVEIHKEVLYIHHWKIFRGREILENKYPVSANGKKVYIPSLENMMVHNVLHAQLNDNGYNNYNIFLKQMYDFRLLSLRGDSFEAVKNFGKKRHYFNAYLAVISYVFSKPSGIIFNKSIRSKYYVKKLDFFLSHHTLYKTSRIINYLYSRLHRYISVIGLSFFQKVTRRYFLKRLVNRKYYREQFLSYVRFFKWFH